MGTDKADVPFGTSTMLETVVHAVAQVGEPVVVGRTSAPPGARAVPDREPPGRGPLAGLETALALHPGTPVVLVAVDQPFVRAETLVRLLDSPGDAVVPYDERPQVTCAVYRPAFLAAASAALDEGERSLVAALTRADAALVRADEWRGWGEDGRSWFGVDTPARRSEGLRRYG